MCDRFKMFETTLPQINDLVEHWDRTTLSKITPAAEGGADGGDEVPHLHPPSGRGLRVKGKPGMLSHLSHEKPCNIILQMVDYNKFEVVLVFV